MTDLLEIVDPTLLAEMIAEGYINLRVHPTLPLHVYNYSAKAQYEQKWNDATKLCRGLVATFDCHIVSRPFRKFYNYGDDQIKFSLDGPIQVTEKMDGSLICVSQYDGQRIVSSRGSFESDHAGWAEELLDDFMPPSGETYIFELIHPNNRIVVDYGDRKELILLGIVMNDSGVDYPPAMLGTWKGSTVKRYNFASFDDVLNAPEVKNMEGFVVKFLDNGERLKIKFPEYVKLHKIMTNFSELAIWEVLSTDGDLTDWLTNVPDEFYKQVQDTVKKLDTQFKVIACEIQADLDAVITKLDLRPGKPVDRKAFATEAVKSKHKSALFATLDGRLIDDYIWKQLRPRGDAPKIDSKSGFNKRVDVDKDVVGRRLIEVAKRAVES